MWPSQLISGKKHRSGWIAPALAVHIDLAY